MTALPASRAEGLQRLASFAPHTGRDYAAGRNTDNGPGQHSHVSMLSPYVRYRLITERDVVRGVLARHSLQAAEKYVQEVLWRTYWKGWLEMRPAVWQLFMAERDKARMQVPDTGALQSAESGTTGIDGFDDWARQLVQTGYLHNHARMWFASIWIFTLRLPWALGADFFLRHLLDADAASNTLSWRWVAGLQTAGKTYLASADNIARYTNGRFSPKGLAGHAEALTEGPMPPPAALPFVAAADPIKPSLLLITPEDMNPETVISDASYIKAALIAVDPRHLWSDTAATFVSAAAGDTCDRAQKYYKCPCEITDTLDSTTLQAAAQKAGATQILTPYTPVGPVADALDKLALDLSQAGITLVQIRRSWDTRFWPHAQKGFFPFKEKISAELVKEGLL
jgi:deoxyribodipyrimidine photo-lyase